MIKAVVSAIKVVGNTHAKSALKIEKFTNRYRIIYNNFILNKCLM